METYQEESTGCSLRQGGLPKVATFTPSDTDDEGNQAPFGLQYLKFKMIDPLDLMKFDNDVTPEINNNNQSNEVSMINNAISNKATELGIFTLEYCGGCNVFKDRLTKEHIPFVTLQMVDKTGARNADISKAYEELTGEYHFSGKVPALTDVRDISDNLMHAVKFHDIGYDANHYETISQMAQDFNACTANNRNIGACIDRFVNDYHAYEATCNSPMAYHQNDSMLLTI
jgi:hypothetical protein